MRSVKAVGVRCGLAGHGAVGQGGLGWARKVGRGRSRRSGRGPVWSGVVGQGGLGWARCGELRTGKLRCDGSRRSR